jgi:hypothetical protein
MPLFASIILLTQIAFAVHVVKTGRPIFWIFLIVFVPLIGCIVYGLVEVLPGLTQTRTARSVRTTLDTAINSERDFRALVAAVDDLPTPHNKHLLASELIRRGDYVSARNLYESALIGPHESDPTLLMGLARSLFMLGDAEGALRTLDRLQAENPGFQSHDGHLLYARALAGAGRNDEAIAEYKTLVPIYPGQEARARYALLLLEMGRTAEAAELFSAIVGMVDRGSKEYRRMQREWYELAKARMTV